MSQELKHYQKRAADFEQKKAEELVAFSEQQNEHVILLLNSLKERFPKAEAQFKLLGGPWRSSDELRRQLRTCHLKFLEHLTQALRPRIKLAGEDSYPILLALLDLIEAHFYASMFDRAPEMFRNMSTQLSKIPTEKLGKLLRVLYKNYPENARRDELNTFVLSFGDGTHSYDKKIKDLQESELKTLGKIIKKRLKTEEDKQLMLILGILEKYLSAHLILRSQKY